MELFVVDVSESLLLSLKLNTRFWRSLSRPA
jgi:hypothetical protein